MTLPMVSLPAAQVTATRLAAPNTQTAGPSAPAAPDSIRRSAEALEASFLAEMLKNAGVFRPTEGLGSGGEGEEQFSSFLADEQARAIVARGGLGLADSIENALRLRAQGHTQGGSA